MLELDLSSSIRDSRLERNENGIKETGHSRKGAKQEQTRKEERKETQKEGNETMASKSRKKKRVDETY